MTAYKFYPTNTNVPAPVTPFGPEWAEAGLGGNVRVAAVPASSTAQRWMHNGGASHKGPSEARYEYVGQIYVEAGGLPLGPLVGSFRMAVAADCTYYTSNGTPTSSTIPRRLRVIVKVVTSTGAVKGTVFDGESVDFHHSETRSHKIGGPLIPGVTIEPGDRVIVEDGGYIPTQPSGLYTTNVAYANRSRSMSGGLTNSIDPDVPYADGVPIPAATADAGTNAWFEFEILRPPHAPTNLAARDVSQTTALLDWDAPTTGDPVDGYDVRLDGGAPVALGSATEYALGPLDPSRTYVAEVRSRNAAGVSAWVPVTFETSDGKRPAPGIASQAVLAAAGLDPDPLGVDAPAQQWWDVDAIDAETYNPVRSGGLISWAIGYGARDPLGRGGAVTVTVALLVPVDDAVSIGDRFRLRLAPALVEALGLSERAAIRATAIVTDAVADPVRSWDLPGAGPAILWNVTASGWYSRYGAAAIDGTSWPVEPVGARIRRVLDSLGLTGDVDATGANVRPMGGAGSHHQALAAATDSTLGRLVEQRTGLVDYHDPEDRRGTMPTLSLDASEILGENFSWRQSVGDVQNSAEVTYGTGAKVLVEDRASADPRSGVGPYPVQISTILDQQLDAYDLAADTVGRRAWPFYQLPAVAVDLARSGLDLARVAGAFEVVVGDRVALSSMPPGSPWESTPRGCFVEGYTETATAYAWRLSLVVSDPAMSGVSLRYIDVPDTITYADVAADLSYLDVSRIEDPADLL